MKHLKFLFLFIGLAIFASCSESDVEGGVIGDANQAIFSGIIGELQTRVTDNSWDSGDAIGVYALMADQALSDAAIFDGKSNVKYTTSGNGTFTVAGAPINFPETGNLDFVSYYPFKTAITDYKYSIDVTSQSDMAAIDLLYSNNAKGQTKSSPNVDLQFNHMLSKFEMNVQLGEDLTSLEGLTVNIKSVIVDGSLALVDGAITTGTTRKDITPKVSIASGNKTATVAAIVVPGQNLEDITIVFSLDGKDYEWTPASQELLSTYKYAYTIKLTLDASGEPIVVPVNIGATINDWNDPQIGDTPIVLEPEGEDPVEGDKIDIADFRALAVKGETYSEDKFIEGEVILNPSLKNVTDFIAYVADETAGLTLAFTDAENVLSKMPLGAKVKINVQNSEWDEYNGLIQLKLSTDNVEIVEAKNSTPLVPRVVTIQDILDGKHQSELVQVNNVQFKDVPTTYNGGKKLVNIENEEITVFTRSQAAFAGNNVIEGNGPFIGVVSIYNTPQLLIRTTADLSGMTDDRFSPSFINTDPASLAFEKAGGNETITVTANVAWTATSDVSWLTVAPASGTNNGTITVTATENGVDARNATITITDGTITKTVSVTQKGEEASGGDFATDLFFSEYIEGGGFNKFLEIYNGTGETVDLSNYKVETYMNGDATTDKVLELTGTLEHGKVLVIYNSQSEISPGSNAIVDNNIANFNGNDAVALMKTSGEYVDIIGHIGEEVNWSVDGNSTKDNTLVRKPGIRSGVTASTAGFPELGTEWIGYPKDTGDYIGSHTTDY